PYLVLAAIPMAICAARLRPLKHMGLTALGFGLALCLIAMPSFAIDAAAGSLGIQAGAIIILSPFVAFFLTALPALGVIALAWLLWRLDQQSLIGPISSARLYAPG